MLTSCRSSKTSQHGDTFYFENSLVSEKTEGMLDLENSLIFYRKTWNKWPDHILNLYNLINQQVIWTKDSLTNSLSEFETLGLSLESDSLDVYYDYKDPNLDDGKFRIWEVNDSTFTVVSGSIVKQIKVRKRKNR